MAAAAAAASASVTGKHPRDEDDDPDASPEKKGRPRALVESLDSMEHVHAAAAAAADLEWMTYSVDREEDEPDFCLVLPAIKMRVLFHSSNLRRVCKPNVHSILKLVTEQPKDAVTGRYTVEVALPPDFVNPREKARNRAISFFDFLTTHSDGMARNHDWTRVPPLHYMLFLELADYLGLVALFDIGVAVFRSLDLLQPPDGAWVGRFFFSHTHDRFWEKLAELGKRFHWEDWVGNVIGPIITKSEWNRERRARLFDLCPVFRAWTAVYFQREWESATSKLQMYKQTEQKIDQKLKAFFNPALHGVALHCRRAPSRGSVCSCATPEEHKITWKHVPQFMFPRPPLEALLELRDMATPNLTSAMREPWTVE